MKPISTHIPTSAQTRPERSGRRGQPAPARTAGAPRVSAIQATSAAAVASENASGAARQPPAASASRTAAAAAAAGPTWMPVV